MMMSASATLARETAIVTGNPRAAFVSVEILERGQTCNTIAGGADRRGDRQDRGFGLPSVTLGLLPNRRTPNHVVARFRDQTAARASHRLPPKGLHHPVGFCLLGITRSVGSPPNGHYAELDPLALLHSVVLSFRGLVISGRAAKGIWGDVG